MDRKTRMKAWILLALVSAAMLIPIRKQTQEGGTVRWQAMLYTVTKWNSETAENHRIGRKTGTQVHILFWDVYNTVTFVPDDIDMVIQPAG